MTKPVGRWRTQFCKSQAKMLTWTFLAHSRKESQWDLSWSSHTCVWIPASPWTWETLLGSALARPTVAQPWDGSVPAGWCQGPEEAEKVLCSLSLEAGAVFIEGTSIIQCLFPWMLSPARRGGSAGAAVTSSGSWPWALWGIFQLPSWVLWLWNSGLISPHPLRCSFHAAAVTRQFWGLSPQFVSGVLQVLPGSALRISSFQPPHDSWAGQGCSPSLMFLQAALGCTVRSDGWPWSLQAEYLSPNPYFILLLPHKILVLPSFHSQ